jgi:hypothetical protein
MFSPDDGRQIHGDPRILHVADDENSTVADDENSTVSEKRQIYPVGYVYAANVGE